MEKKKLVKWLETSQRVKDYVKNTFQDELSRAENKDLPVKLLALTQTVSELIESMAEELTIIEGLEDAKEVS